MARLLLPSGKGALAGPRWLAAAAAARLRATSEAGLLARGAGYLRGRYPPRNFRFEYVARDLARGTFGPAIKSKQ